MNESHNEGGVSAVADQQKEAGAVAAPQAQEVAGAEFAFGQEEWGRSSDRPRGTGMKLLTAPGTAVTLDLTRKAGVVNVIIKSGVSYIPRKNHPLYK